MVSGDRESILSGVCEHLDDSERAGAQRTCPHIALAEKIDSEGFTGDYPFDFQSCESLWVV